MANDLIDKAKELAGRVFRSGDIQVGKENAGLITRFEQDVLSDMWGRFETRKKQRLNLELQWRLNMAFYNGDQFTEIHAGWGDIRTIPPATEYEERNVFNEIAPNIETILALMNKYRNNVRCRPSSTSSENRTAARVGDKVVASARRTMDFPSKQRQSNLSAVILGSAVSKTIWDSAAGRVVGYGEHAITEEERREFPVGYDYESELVGRDKDLLRPEIKEGDATINIVSPFEIFPENLSLPCSKQRKIMQVQVLSPDEVLERWGAYVKGEDNDTFRLTNTSARDYGGMLNRVYGTTLAVEKAHDTVLVLEEWELPSGRFPFGRLTVCTKDKLLYCGSLPDRYCVSGGYKLPFDVQQSLMTDGFFGKSVIERVIPVQRSLNRLKNSIADYNNRITIGVLAVERGSLGDDEDRLLTEGVAPGDIVSYRQGAYRPYFLEPAKLPPEIFREVDNLIEQINRMTGVSEFAKQSAPPGNIIAASALAGVVEQDYTRSGLLTDQAKEFWVNNHIKLLSLYHDNVKYPRMVKDIGRSQEFEISSFIGSDLTSFDVEIVPEPANELSLGQMRQKAVELLNAGLFNDPMTGGISKEMRQALLEILEFGNWEILVEEDDKHLARARRENQSILAGEEGVIRSFDEDIIHIAEHNNVRLTAEYEERLKEDPDVDARFERHIDEHMRNLQSKSGPDQQEQAAFSYPTDPAASVSPEQFAGA